MMMDNAFVEVRFAGDLVGRVTDAHGSQGTWFATLDLAPELRRSERHQRLVNFIDLSVSWNQQTLDDPHGAPGAEVFDCYMDIIESDSWTVIDGKGEAHQLQEALVFLTDCYVSWRDPVWDLHFPPTTL